VSGPHAAIFERISGWYDLRGCAQQSGLQWFCRLRAVAAAEPPQRWCPPGRHKLTPRRADPTCDPHVPVVHASSTDDLLLAAALRPRLAADYHQAEIDPGHRFTHKLSAGETLAGLHATRLEARGAPVAGDAKVDLREMVRDPILGTHVLHDQRLSLRYIHSL
jgi:hypothetical protein